MVDAIAPVLGRIAEIEARFDRGTAPLATAAFGAVYEAAEASLIGHDAVQADPLTPSPSGVGGAGMPAVWTGVGSGGWVYPNGGGSVSGVAPATSASGMGLSAATGAVPPSVPYAAEFEAAAARHGVPPRLLAAVGWVESRYQTDVVSDAGAEGLMQLMPFVSEHYGVNPWDPAQATDAAARVLAEHHQRFGSWDLALAAYNAGAGAVAAAGNQPPSDRVAGYVAAVNQRIEQM